MKKLIILALVFVICTILSGCAKKNVVTSSNLIDAVEIDELYGSEFVYNGVTQIPVERNNYNIKYNSTVKVGINTSDLSFDIRLQIRLICAKMGQGSRVTCPGLACRLCAWDAGRLFLYAFSRCSSAAMASSRSSASRRIASISMRSALSNAALSSWSSCAFMPFGILSTPCGLFADRAAGLAPCPVDAATVAQPPPSRQR